MSNSGNHHPRWSTRSIDVTITLDNIEDQIRKLVAKIKPWKEDAVKMKKLAGGILNLMYCCWHQDLGMDSESIVVRIHQRPPSMTENMEENDTFDPKKEIDVLEKISSTSLGPELLVIFNNGLCYNYLPGDTLNIHSVRSEKFIPYVTKLIARIHTLPLMERDTSWNIQTIFDIVPDYPPTFKDPNRLKRVLEVLPDKETFLKEAHYLSDHLPTLGSPKVLCHNDTKGENFIWNEKTGVLKLIDFEHSGNNYQAFEIGHHFASYNDVLGSTPDTYPDRDFQLRWIRQYLQYWYEFTGKKASDVTDKDVQRLYVQANNYAQMSRLVLGVALLNEDEGRTDCYEFCINNLKDYFKFRDEVNAMVLPE